MRCTGVILAGGKASRFGGKPKGLEVVGGHRIIDRVASSLSAVCDSLLLIANAPDAGEWLPGIRCERDVQRGEGSLGGLHAALTHAATPVIVVAWDMPFVPSALLRELRVGGERGGVLAFAPESGRVRADGERGGKHDTRADALRETRSDAIARANELEPFCAWYSDAALSVVEQMLSLQERRMQDALIALRCEAMPLAAVRAFGDPRRLFLNVNTDENLAEARRISTEHDTAS